ncbi:MAG TPA: hypothetical protein VGE06_09370 [Flavisolibacter sp.]
MKKQFFFLPFMVIAVSYPAITQEIASLSIPSPVHLPVAVKKRIASESIHLKFYDDYPTVTDDAWATTENGFLVNFSSGEIKYTVFLDHRGMKISQIRYSKEGLLPDAVRKRIKDNFPCFKIGWVKEISSKNLMAYQVRIENDWEWKLLKINEAEMDIREAYRKD